MRKKMIALTKEQIIYVEKYKTNYGLKNFTEAIRHVIDNLVAPHFAPPESVGEPEN